MHHMSDEGRYLNYQRKFRRETSELRTVEKWSHRASEVKELVK